MPVIGKWQLQNFKDKCIELILETENFHSAVHDEEFEHKSRRYRFSLAYHRPYEMKEKFVETPNIH